MEERIIDSLIKKAEQTQSDARGGNKDCFISGEYALLRGYIREENMKRLIATGAELKERGINIARTLDYKITEDGTGYSLQERAKGEPLHNRVHWKINPDDAPEQFLIEQQKYSDRLQIIAEEKQEIYDKFVSDWLEIQKAGRRIDPSKVDNFFYQKGEGITFIDLDSEMGESKKITNEITFYEMSAVLMASSKYYKFSKNEELENIINNNISKIFTKLSKSIEKTGILNREEIKTILSERFSYIDLSSLEIEVGEKQKNIKPQDALKNALVSGVTIEDTKKMESVYSKEHSKEI